MQRNKKNVHNRPGKRKDTRKGNYNANALTRPRNDAVLTIPRSVGFVVPDRLRTSLRFWKAPILNFSVLTTQVIRLQPSAAYDIDPSIGGTVPPGFAEMATLYNSYRVRSSRCVVEATNTSATSMLQITLLPTNLDPGGSPTSTYVTSSREQPYATSKSLPPTGGPTVKLSSNMSTEKIFGSPMVRYDDNFAALVNAIPVNNWFWIVAIYAGAVQSAAEPVFVNIGVDIDIDFYDRAFLNRT